MSAAESQEFAMKPGEWGQGPSGKPAIVWWRHGIAAAGEASTVSEVREYEDEAARNAAFMDYRSGR